MDADALDLCKENIQPLRQGRRASTLGLALQAENDTEIQAKLTRDREEYELAIVTYDGDDPLVPRYDYVRWLEQSYPKHGKESNLIPLLEDTIMLFKDEPKYKQDSRLIELIIKYIETQDNELELYQLVYSQGLGTMCAIFYKSWAEALDCYQDVKKADSIYQLGISNHAEPIELLQQSHAHFQLSIGRRMMTGEIPMERQVSSETAERQRKVLGKLKKGGTNRISHGAAGKLPVLGVSNCVKKSVAVFEEDESDLPGISSTKSKIDVLNSENRHKENTTKPQPWNQGSSKKVRHISEPTVPSTPKFQVALDPEDEKTPQHEMKPTPSTSTKILKIRKQELEPIRSLELFKSPHPGLKNNLPKFEVFAGGKEFCFEEIRWAYYRKQITKTCLDYTVETPTKFGTPYRYNFDSDFTPLKTPRRPPLATCSEADEDEEMATPSHSKLLGVMPLHSIVEDDETIVKKLEPTKKTAFTIFTD